MQHWICEYPEKSLCNDPITRHCFPSYHRLADNRKCHKITSCYDFAVNMNPAVRILSLMRWNSTPILKLCPKPNNAKCCSRKFHDIELNGSLKSTKTSTCRNYFVPFIAWSHTPGMYSYSYFYLSRRLTDWLILAYLNDCILGSIRLRTVPCQWFLWILELKRSTDQTHAMIYTKLPGYLYQTQLVPSASLGRSKQ